MPRQRLKRINFKWTPDLAYAVGLITTDGCLSKDKRHVDFTSKDLCQIQTFKKVLSLKNKIGTKTNGRKNGVYYRVQFGNVVFYDWLTKIGLSSRKSLTINSLKINPFHFRDFVRGCLDGDGSIISYTDKYNTYLNPKYTYQRLFVNFFSGSHNYLNWLQNTIWNQLGIKGAILTSKNAKRPDSRYYALKFSTKEARVLLNWIYYRKDLPKLERKFQIAQPFLSSF